jgi:hypothetical protein
MEAPGNGDEASFGRQADLPDIVTGGDTPLSDQIVTNRSQPG